MDESEWGIKGNLWNGNKDIQQHHHNKFNPHPLKRHFMSTLLET